MKVIDRPRPGRFERRNYILGVGEQTIVCRGALAALLVPLGQVSQFNQQESGLDCIQPAVIPFYIVVVLHGLAVIADHLYFLCQPGIVCCDCACLSTCPQVLPGIKAECRRLAHGAGLHPLIPLAGKVLCAVGLAGIFNHDEIVLLRNLQNRIHVSSLSVKMDRNYRRYGLATSLTDPPA